MGTKEILASVAATNHVGSVRWGMARLAVGHQEFGALDYARDLAAIEKPSVPRAAAPHPQDSVEAVRATSAMRRESETTDGKRTSELSAAELVWLQRLPMDPAEVSDRDAARLSGLVAGAQYLAPSSRSLLESVWEPVKRLHDRRIAEHDLEVASQPPAAVPASVQGALRAAVKIEHQDWPEEAVRAHATKLLDRAIADRDAAHESLVAQARRRLEALSETNV